MEGNHRHLDRQATTGLKKRVLQRTCWLPLKTPANLDSIKGELARRREALRLSEFLATADCLMENLRQICAHTLLAHSHGILAWYDYPISTGPLEGANTGSKP